MIKIDRKDIYNLTKVNKCCYFELSSHQIILNQHIKMISEGSCDTEDWSNDAENSALQIIQINCIVKYITIERKIIFFSHTVVIVFLYIYLF